MTDEKITALIAEARTYARKEIVAESRDGEQMHRTVAEILTDTADALEASLPTAPRELGPNEPATYWHGAGCEEDDRG